MVYTKQNFYFPLKVLLAFNIFTLIVFEFGSIDWQLSGFSHFLLILYLGTNLCALYLGYKRALKNYKIKKLYGNIFDNNRKKIYFIIFVAILWMLPLMTLRLGLTVVNPTDIANKLVEGLINPTKGYFEKFEAIKMTSKENRTLLRAVNFFFTPVMYAFFIWGFLYFKRLKFWRFFVLILFVLEILSWIAIGTNKGVVDLAFIMFFLFYYLKPEFFKIELKKLILGVAILSTIFLYFLNNTSTRHIGDKSTSYLSDLDLTILDNPIKDDGLYKDISIETKFSSVMLAAYLAQGYYCLALSFEAPTTWTYGLGNSWFGVEVYRTLTGGDLIRQTYLGYLSDTYNIDPEIYWHTIYLWLANDFTFYGVPFIVFAIGYGLGLSWMDMIYKRTVYAAPAFCLFALMVFYFYANNQIISFSTLPFIVFVLLWIIKRR